MYQEINIYQFRDQFNEIRPDNFSYDGLTAIYDYFEQLEDDIGEKIEFDPIAVCCEYSEYDSLEELNQDYSHQYASLEELEESTTVLRIPDSDGFVIQQF